MGHDVNAADNEKRSPLHYAVAYRCRIPRQPLGLTHAGPTLSLSAWLGSELVTCMLATCHRQARRWMSFDFPTKVERL